MDPMTAPARSWLFVPATRPERFAKAAASGADRVIVDLEDAVAPGEKAAARRALAGAPLPASVPVYLRVNDASTEWFAEDVAAAARLALAGVVLPKAESAAQVARAAAALGAGKAIVAIVESAAALWGALEVARAPNVERLAFGAFDFQLDTGIAGEDVELAYARSRLVLASRVAGVGAPIDSVTAAIDDPERVARDAERSLRFGFAGKLCIHPRQVAPTHAAFRPGAADVEWATGLLAAYDALPEGARGAFAYRGGMVDRPVLLRARRIAALAGADAARRVEDAPP
jgi:citrate lyase subunit beta/citryl-CoA lyase